MDFPKFARAIRTTIQPLSPADGQQITSVLTHAHIKFIQEDDDQTLGIYGKHSELSSKLSIFLQDAGGPASEYYHIAKRLRKDMQFRAILG
ncbi:MAG: hypothetical protein E4G98_03245 [Promethearchaeota archaeon]|nr:MAG: hypothetical protein E4G98_03245 [Candidatus Lokiarchaeota archaeon]